MKARNVTILGALGGLAFWVLLIGAMMLHLRLLSNPLFWFLEVAMWPFEKILGLLVDDWDHSPFYQNAAFVLVAGAVYFSLLGILAIWSYRVFRIIKPRHEPKEGHCVCCGHMLKGLPEPRCPECGTPFDPNAPGCEQEKYRALRRGAILVLGSATLAGFGCAWLLLRLGDARFPMDSDIYGLVLFLVIIILFVWSTLKVAKQGFFQKIRNAILRSVFLGFAGRCAVGYVRLCHILSKESIEQNWPSSFGKKLLTQYGFVSFGLFLYMAWEVRKILKSLKEMESDESAID